MFPAVHTADWDCNSCGHEWTVQKNALQPIEQTCPECSSPQITKQRTYHR